MSWDVQFYDVFDAEFEELPEAVQDELLAHARLLEEFGPQLGRPSVDTLNGSKHANMKELRFNAADGVWRVAFAFDGLNGIIRCRGVGLNVGTGQSSHVHVDRLAGVFGAGAGEDKFLLQR